MTYTDLVRQDTHNRQGAGTVTSAPWGAVRMVGGTEDPVISYVDSDPRRAVRQARKDHAANSQRPGCDTGNSLNYSNPAALSLSDVALIAALAVLVLTPFLIGWWSLLAVPAGITAIAAMFAAVKAWKKAPVRGVKMVCVDAGPGEGQVLLVFTPA